MVFTSRQHPLHSDSHWIRDLVFLFLLFSIFYAIGMGSHPLFIPDEGRYSEVAREMLVSHDFITPRLNGVAFLDKPALYYWLQASAIKVFGLNEWALRFWPATLGILGALVTYVCGRLLYTRRTGFISALILATSPLYYGAAHYANLDLEVASLIGISLLSFITAMKASEHKQAFLITSYVFAGLAALTKGLIGIVFPALIIGLWILCLNRWRVLLQMRLVLGLTIFTLIVFPWYFLVQKANPEFLHFFFVTQQVSRFLTTQDFNDKAAIWFYIPVVLGGLIPWSLFLIQALYRKIQAVFQDRFERDVDLYLLIWFFVVLMFFSIPKSKTVGYILPIFPVSALIVGDYLNGIWESTAAQKLRQFFIGMAILIGLGFLSTPLFAKALVIPSMILPHLQVMGLCFLISALISFLLLSRKNFLAFFAVLFATIAAVLLIFTSSLTAMNVKSTKSLAMQIKPYLKSDDEIITFYKYYQDLPLYLERRITIVADWHAPDIQKRDNWLREMWYGMVFQDTKDWLIQEEDFWKRWEGPKRIFVVTDAGYFEKIRAKSPAYKIAQNHETVLFSNQAWHPS